MCVSGRAEDRWRGGGRSWETETMRMGRIGVARYDTARRHTEARYIPSAQARSSAHLLCSGARSAAASSPRPRSRSPLPSRACSLASSGARGWYVRARGSEWTDAARPSSPSQRQRRRRGGDESGPSTCLAPPRCLGRMLPEVPGAPDMRVSRCSPQWPSLALPHTHAPLLSLLLLLPRAPRA